jgi:hypothetical protein
LSCHVRTGHWSTERAILEPMFSGVSWEPQIIPICIQENAILLCHRVFISAGKDTTV